MQIANYYGHKKFERRDVLLALRSMSLNRSLAGRSRIASAATVMILCASGSFAQTAGGVQYNDDFFIDSVSVFGDYFSSGLQQLSATDAGQLSADGGYGAQATLAFRRTRERSTFSMRYTPSYTGRIRYTDWNAASHLLDLSLDRSLGARLRLGLSLSGNLSTTQSFAFNPSQLSSLASSPGSASNLAAIMGDRSPAPILAGSLTGLPGADSATRFELFGNRVFAASADAHLAYSISPRLTLSFGATASRTQAVPTDGFSGSVLPTVMSENGSVALSYSLTPRTQVAVDVQGTRVQTGRIIEYLTLSSASIERMVSRRWFVQGSGGAGTVISDIRTGTPVQYTVGGGLGFRAYTQTLLGSYNRRIGSIYGLGASASHDMGGAWRWSRPGFPWWLSIAANRYQVVDSQIQIENWRANAEAGRFLSRTIAFSAQYVYLSSAFSLNRGSTPIRMSAVRVALLWQPRGVRMPETQTGTDSGAGGQQSQGDRQ